MEEIKYPKVTLIDVLKKFWTGVREYKLLAITLTLSVMIASTIDIIIPLYYKDFFDTLIKPDDKTFLAVALMQIVFIILGLNGLKWLVRRYSTFADIRFLTNMMAILRQQAFNYLINHSFSFFSNNFTGSLVQRVNRFARAFDRLADRIIWNLVPILVRIVGIGSILWFIEPVASVILVVWAFVFLLFNYLFALWKLKYDIDVTVADSRTTGVLADSITNHNTIQLFTGQSKEFEYFKEVTTDQAKTHQKALNLGAIAEAVQGLLIVLVEFGIFYVSIKLWVKGTISVGFFVLIQAYLLELAFRLWDFSRVIRDLYESYADAKEMVEIMSLPHFIQDIPKAKKLKITEGKIELKNLNFEFHKDKEIIKNINTIIKPGEKVALIGPSGAGKSTIVKLLLRLHDPVGGEILVDDQDIKKVTQNSLRENISLVPQDPLLFHRTLLENIRYGRRNATDEEVKEAARKAHCDEFVKELPQGFETYVGERGIKLSGGERQRVAIARAILKNPPILILDEATSSLDSHSEMLIQDALDELMKGKTVIAIAHRLSTIKKMDRIIVLEGGKIKEEGTHDELLKKEDSLYKKLWTLQAGGFIKEDEKDN